MLSTFLITRGNSGSQVQIISRENCEKVHVKSLNKGQSMYKKQGHFQPIAYLGKFAQSLHGDILFSVLIKV